MDPILCNLPLNLRVGDQRVLKLIQAWLKAGVMEGDKWHASGEQGTIQGGSISPLLANVYLHYVLDLWFEKKIRPQYQNKANLVRYCDDFCLFFNSATDVESMQSLLKIRLANFGLTISDKKTHRTNLSQRNQSSSPERRHLTFLGFTIYRAKKIEGAGSKTVFQTDSSRLGRSLRSVRISIKRIQHWSIEDQVKVLRSILHGHFNYYGIAGNSRRLSQFRNKLVNEWRHSLSRRSHKGRITWEKLATLIKEHPLPNPRIKLSYPDLQNLVRL